MEKMIQAQQLCKKDHVQGEQDGRAEASIPVWVRGGQHKLELHQAGAIRELPVLQAVQFVGKVPAPHVHLGRGVAGGTTMTLPPPHISMPPARAHVPPHDPPSPHLQCRHAHHLVGMVEEDGKHVKDGGF